MFVSQFRRLIQFKTYLQKFKEKGEKSGWTYIPVSREQAHQLNPGVRSAFRVKGALDDFMFESLSLLPMGDGSFILAVNGTIRKKIKKEKGDPVVVQLAFQEQPYQPDPDFVECLNDEPSALQFFNTLPISHQNYFSKWVESAKTEATRTKRIAMAINALSKKMSFPEMLKSNRSMGNV